MLLIDIIQRDNKLQKIKNFLSIILMAQKYQKIYQRGDLKHYITLFNISNRISYNFDKKTIKFSNEIKIYLYS